MAGNWIYIALTVVVLAALVLVMVRMRGKGKDSRMSPLMGVALACIMGGLIFGDQRWLGYGLLVVGAVLAVIDILKRGKS